MRCKVEASKLWRNTKHHGNGEGGQKHSHTARLHAHSRGHRMVQRRRPCGARFRVHRRLDGATGGAYDAVALPRTQGQGWYKVQLQFALKFKLHQVGGCDAACRCIGASSNGIEP
jgi:hypothetical protein